MTHEEELNKAAEEYEHSLGYYECINQWPSVAFIAGANYAMEQGTTVETEVVSRVMGNGVFKPAVSFLVDESYKTGDKVIVQIRKKDE